MKDIKLIENFLILDKKNEFNDIEIDDIRKLLEIQINEIKEWKWYNDKHSSEIYPFSIIFLLLGMKRFIEILF